METHSEKFPADGRPDPSRRAEDRFFDANEGSDQPGIANHEEKDRPGSAGNGLHHLVAGRGPLRPAGQGLLLVAEEGQAAS